MAKTVAIIGGGLQGALAAIACARRGWDVVVPLVDALAALERDGVVRDDDTVGRTGNGRRNLHPARGIDC